MSDFQEYPKWVPTEDGGAIVSSKEEEDVLVKLPDETPQVTLKLSKRQPKAE